jgi:hypothetical protein
MSELRGQFAGDGASPDLEDNSGHREEGDSENGLSLSTKVISGKNIAASVQVHLPRTRIPTGGSLGLMAGNVFVAGSNIQQSQGILNLHVQVEVCQEEGESE